MSDRVDTLVPPMRDIISTPDVPSPESVDSRRPALDEQGVDSHTRHTELPDGTGDAEGHKPPYREHGFISVDSSALASTLLRTSEPTGIPTCHRGPVLLLDKCPYASHANHISGTSYRRGRCPAQEAVTSQGICHYHALVALSPVNVDMASVTSLQVEFGDYVGSGSLSDGFRARLWITQGASTEALLQTHDRNPTLNVAFEDPTSDTEKGCGGEDRADLIAVRRAELPPGPIRTSDVITPCRTLDVVVKVTRPGYRQRKGLTRRDMMDQILREADLYTTNMAPLQGTVVPRFYGVWALGTQPCSPADDGMVNWPVDTPSLSECVLTILEDVGSPVGKDDEASRARLEEAERGKVREAHHALHRVGVIHGAASHKMSHTMLDASGRVRLIDFERSERCEPVVRGQPLPKAVADELNKLDDYLRGRP